MHHNGLIKYEILRQITETGVVAVIRAENAESAYEKAKACLAGGIKAIEVTYTVDGATEVIRRLSETLKDEMMIGAGTVLDSETARIAILAGAKFIVSPGFDEQTARLCNRYQIPYLPGCMTVTEIIKALESGVDIVKLFPGSAFGPSMIKALKGPLPQVAIMPTGGVSLENVQQWIENGAIALGIGGGLTEGSFDEIKEKSAKVVKAVAEARK